MVDFMDDKQLLGELKRGNNAAFEFLFKSYYPRLRGYAIRFIEDEETVRDIIQECFLRFGNVAKCYLPSHLLLFFFYGPQWMSKLSEASLDC